MTTPPVAHVTPGGPALRLDVGGLVLHKQSVSAMDNSCYVLTAPDGAQLLVDAADDAPRLLALLAQARGEAGGARLTVVTTHSHWDHHRALPDVVAATGALVLAGADDADALPVPVDVRLAHGDRVPLGEHVLDVVALRGHTPGSVALAWAESGTHAGRVHLFTGDSLFPGGPGKTPDAAAFASLMDDLEERVFARYPDGTVVHPGHGDATTLGAERPHLAEWRARGW
ncbi:MBL fold metallo-hydrolase [Georgenia sp. MJ206]|uniref:MBL fold metallo-hydrolase n=1 Tax=Georgenia wangjunii TaxID=3117730 RepID=UPI002F268E62